MLLLRRGSGKIRAPVARPRGAARHQRRVARPHDKTCGGSKRFPTIVRPCRTILQHRAAEPCRSAAPPFRRTTQAKTCPGPLGGSCQGGVRSGISHSQKDPRGLWKSEHFCRSAKVPLDMSVTLLTDCRLHNGATVTRLQLSQDTCKMSRGH